MKFERNKKKKRKLFFVDELPSSQHHQQLYYYKQLNKALVTLSWEMLFLFAFIFGRYVDVSEWES